MVTASTAPAGPFLHLPSHNVCQTRSLASQSPFSCPSHCSHAEKRPWPLRPHVLFPSTQLDLSSDLVCVLNVPSLPRESASRLLSKGTATPASALTLFLQLLASKSDSEMASVYSRDVLLSLYTRGSGRTQLREEVRARMNESIDLSPDEDHHSKVRVHQDSLFSFSFLDGSLAIVVMCVKMGRGGNHRRVKDQNGPRTSGRNGVLSSGSLQSLASNADQPSGPTATGTGTATGTTRARMDSGLRFPSGGGFQGGVLSGVGMGRNGKTRFSNEPVDELVAPPPPLPTG